MSQPSHFAGFIPNAPKVLCCREVTIERIRTVRLERSRPFCGCEGLAKWIGLPAQLAVALGGFRGVQRMPKTLDKEAHRGLARTRGYEAKLA